MSETCCVDVALSLSLPCSIWIVPPQWSPLGRRGWQWCGPGGRQVAVSADSIYDSAGRKVARRNRQTERERERETSHLPICNFRLDVMGHHLPLMCAASVLEPHIQVQTITLHDVLLEVMWMCLAWMLLHISNNDSANETNGKLFVACNIESIANCKNSPRNENIHCFDIKWLLWKIYSR